MVVDVRFNRRALSAEEAAAYVGDAPCAGCHPQAVKDHAGTRHAQTMRRVQSRLDAESFSKRSPIKDPNTGLTYRPARIGDRFYMEISNGRQTVRRSADYVLGTGRNAVSFLGQRTPDRFTKLRISYYQPAGEWDLTPQQEAAGPAGVEEEGARLDGCVLCHVTVLRREPDGLRLAESRLGIGCERCHGPGKRHIQEVERTGHDPHIERLKDALPARVNDLCGDCHRTPANASLADPHTEQQLPRFQGVAMSLSACYRKSNALTCTTCHAPHQDGVAGTAFYDATCVRCHQGAPGQSTCPVNARAGCTGCHMPRQKIPTIPHAVYRNHWIKVWKGHGAGDAKQDE